MEEEESIKILADLLALNSPWSGMPTVPTNQLIKKFIDEGWSLSIIAFALRLYRPKVWEKAESYRRAIKEGNQHKTPSVYKPETIDLRYKPDRESVGMNDLYLALAEALKDDLYFIPPEAKKPGMCSLPGCTQYILRPGDYFCYYHTKVARNLMSEWASYNVNEWNRLLWRLQKETLNKKEAEKLRKSASKPSHWKKGQQKGETPWKIKDFPRRYLIGTVYGLAEDEVKFQEYGKEYGRAKLRDKITSDYYSDYGEVDTIYRPRTSGFKYPSGHVGSNEELAYLSGSEEAELDKRGPQRYDESRNPVGQYGVKYLSSRVVGDSIQPTEEAIKDFEILEVIANIKDEEDRKVATLLAYGFKKKEIISDFLNGDYSAWTNCRRRIARNLNDKKIARRKRKPPKFISYGKFKKVDAKMPNIDDTVTLYRGRAERPGNKFPAPHNCYSCARKKCNGLKIKDDYCPYYVTRYLKS